MPKVKPRAVPRKSKPKVSEQKVRALEAKLEAEEHELSGVARPQARGSASLQARQGTVAEPYTRRDGQQTRSTTVHFPVDLHHRLKVAAADTNRKISEIVAEAVDQWWRSNLVS